MKKELLKEIIKEILQEEITDLGRIHSGISTSTEIGKSWNHLIWKLETVVDEVKDFQSLYLTAKNKPQTTEAHKRLLAVVKILESIKPTIAQMDKIQKEDLYE